MAHSRLVAALLAPLLMVLASCSGLGPVLAPFVEPTISPAAPVISSDGNTITFTATITIDESAYTIRRVYVTWGRHGLGLGRFGTATRAPGTTNPWTVTETNSGPAVYANNTALGFIWGIDYSLPGGQDVATKETPQTDLRIGGCTPAMTTATLRAEQAAVMGAWGGVTHPHVDLRLVPTHDFVSYNGIGVAFGIIGATTTATLGSPVILFFAPGPPASLPAIGPLTPPAGTITDAVADPSYRLIGWGYSSAYVPGGEPVLGCIPREAWWLHEAGWHNPGGGFTQTPPAESSPGAARMDGPPPRGLGVWHPRLWDMHLFARPEGTPVIGVVDGSGNAGLDPSGSPGGGSTFPGASFFFPARVP